MDFQRIFKSHYFLVVLASLLCGYSKSYKKYKKFMNSKNPTGQNFSHYFPKKTLVEMKDQNDACICHVRLSLNYLSVSNSTISNFVHVFPKFVHTNLIVNTKGNLISFSWKHVVSSSLNMKSCLKKLKHSSLSGMS